MGSGPDNKENGIAEVGEGEEKKHAGGRPPLKAFFKPAEVLERAEALGEEDLIRQVPLVYLKTLFIALETAKASMRDATWQARFNIAQRVIDSLLDDKTVKGIVLISGIRAEAKSNKKTGAEDRSPSDKEPFKTKWKNMPAREEEEPKK